MTTMSRKRTDKREDNNSLLSPINPRSKSGPSRIRAAIQQLRQRIDDDLSRMKYLDVHDHAANGCCNDASNCGITYTKDGTRK
jgi:hypothetical protein